MIGQRFDFIGLGHEQRFDLLGLGHEQRFDLGRGAENQNGNLRWHLP